MPVIKNEHLAIDYTARDFSSIKEELINYTKRYYPDTYKDFSEASFGSLMLDMVAYVGDTISFYLDYQANESFMQTALEFENIVKLSRQLGYKYNVSQTSQGEVSFYILVPVASIGGGPDLAYVPILKRGTLLQADSGASFILAEDVNFARSSNEIVAGRIDDDGITPLDYAIKANGKIISGQFTLVESEIGGFEKFKKVEVPGGKTVAEIISVFDANGNQYFEVEYLSQDVIYKEITNPDPAQQVLTPNILKPIIVPRRFIVEREANKTFIIFGHGSESDLTADPIAEPNKVVLDLFGKDYITDISFDPNTLIGSDKLGVGPSDTILTILYRLNRSDIINAPVATVRTVSDPRFVFNNRTSLSSTKVDSVVSSLEVINADPIIGDQVNSSTEEIRQKAYGSFYSQNRAVTVQDYKSMIYSMPPRFGAIARCSIVKDHDAFKRNLNLYTLCKDSSNNLVVANSSIKQNLKNWINKHRMINDSIDILDAIIVNFGIKFEILGQTNQNNSIVLNNCLLALISNFNKKPDIGEFLDITAIYKLLNSVVGVADTVNIQIRQKFGPRYADTFFDLESAYSPDRRYIQFPPNAIYEFKFGTDFEGTVR